MFKKFRKFSIVTAAILVISSCQLIVSAQEKSKIVSGDYESLIIGVNANGELTGYFSDSTGVDEDGNPRFSCTFFIYGAKETGGIYRIKTWFPEFPEDVIEGELKFVEVGVKNGVNIKLEGEHDGCMNVTPFLKEEKGLDFSLSSAGNWESVRMISPKRVWLFKSIDAGAPQKIFVDKNDAVKVLQTKNGWAEVRYSDPNGRSAAGWMKISDFYGLEPK